MSKPKAIIKECSDDQGAHELRDFCFKCSPFWWLIPTCPIDERQLSQKGHCRVCKKYYDISESEV